MGLGANNSKRLQGVLLPLCSLSLEDCCFYLALIIYLLWRFSQGTMLALPNTSRLNTLIHFGSLGLFAMSCIGHIKLDANFFMALALGTVGLLVKLCADSFSAVDLAVIFYAAHRFDFKKIAKVSLAVVALACLFIVVCSQVGIVQDYPFTRGSTIRHGLGFLYCTYLSHYYLNLVLLYVYVRPQVKAPELVVLLLGDIAIYLATDSRNSFLMVILVLLFVVLHPRLKGLAGGRAALLIRKLTGWSFVLFTVICFALPLMYNADSTVWCKANSVTSNRLAQTQAALGDYGITLFGQDIELLGNGLGIDENGVFSGKERNSSGDQNYVDSSFVSIPIHNGAVLFAVILVIMTLGSIRLSRECGATVLVVILITVLHASIDDLFLSLQYSSFLFLFWDYAILELANCRQWFSPRARVAGSLNSANLSVPESTGLTAPNPPTKAAIHTYDYNV